MCIIYPAQAAEALNKKLHAAQQEAEASTKEAALAQSLLEGEGHIAVEDIPRLGLQFSKAMAEPGDLLRAHTAGIELQLVDAVRPPMLPNHVLCCSHCSQGLEVEAFLFRNISIGGHNFSFHSLTPRPLLFQAAPGPAEKPTQRRQPVWMAPVASASGVPSTRWQRSSLPWAWNDVDFTALGAASANSTAPVYWYRMVQVYSSRQSE